MPLTFLAVALLLFSCCSCVSLHVSEGGASGALVGDGRSERASQAHLCGPLSEGLFVVQAGAFRKMSHAQALRKKLEGKGYKSYITISGAREEDNILRVLVGRYTDRSEAMHVADEIRQKHAVDVIVTAKPPKGKFVVQAGCYATMNEAVEMRESLAARGFNAYIALSTSGNQKKYNVLLGEFLEREAAEDAARDVGQKTRVPVFVNTM